jgi:hypothetical protein
MAYIGVPPADRTSGARVRDEFTADGTQVCFQLSQEVPGSFESNIIAVVENVIQEPVSAYTIVDTITLALTSISGTFTKNETVTGGTSAATGKVIQVNTSSIVITVTTGTFQTETITGGSSSATATISSRTTNIGRGLNFSGTPSTGVKIYALHQASATYNLKPAAGSVTPDSLSENLRTFTVDKFTATSSQTAFTLSATPVSVKSILVFVDGVMQTETTHYTLSAATLTIGSALTAGQQVTVVHLGFSTVSRTAFPDASITTAMLADGSITSAKIADGTVIAADVADGAITTAKLNSTLDLSGKTITYRSIVAGDLASNAITTAKITDANVTPAKLSTGAPSWDSSSNSTFGGSNVGVNTYQGTSTASGVRISTPGTDGTWVAIQTKTNTNLYLSKASSYTDASLMTAYVNGTTIGGLRVTAGDTAMNLYGMSGITFPATQIASADANTLDDYEEGTWTPVITGSTSTGSCTYTAQTGTYTKIGRFVYFAFDLQASSTPSGTGILFIAGLPFTTVNNQFSLSIGLPYWNGIARAFTTMGGYTDGSTSRIVMFGTLGAATGITYMNPSDLPSGSRLFGAGVYQTQN